MYLFNALHGTAKTVKLRRQKEGCAVCGKEATINEPGDCKELYGCPDRIHVMVLIFGKIVLKGLKLFKLRYLFMTMDILRSFLNKKEDYQEFQGEKKQFFKILLLSLTKVW